MGRLYQKVDFDHGLIDDPRGWNANNGPDPSNSWVAQQILTTFVCPSGTNNGKMGGRANVGGTWGVNAYKGVAGANWCWGNFRTNSIAGRPWDRTEFGTTCNGLDRGNGVFFRSNGWHYNTTIAEITDGTSNTLMVGEAVPEWSNHTWWWWMNGSTGTVAVPINPGAQCRGGSKKDKDYRDCRGDWPNNYSFMSRHTGGAHFLLCDGSTRMLSENIDMDVYRGLGTKAGDETPGQF